MRAGQRAVLGHQFGDVRIDVVVSNAGYGLFGAAEELSDEQVSHIIATNLIGSIQLIRASRNCSRSGWVLIEIAGRRRPPSPAHPRGDLCCHDRAGGRRRPSGPGRCFQGHVGRHRPPGSLPASDLMASGHCLGFADVRREARLVAGVGGGGCLVEWGRLDPLEVDLVGGEQHADDEEAKPRHAYDQEQDPGDDGAC